MDEDYSQLAAAHVTENRAAIWGKQRPGIRVPCSSGM